MLFRPLSPKASDAAQFLPDVKINRSHGVQTDVISAKLTY
jgi:hypothetical protein